MWRRRVVFMGWMPSRRIGSVSSSPPMTWRLSGISVCRRHSKNTWTTRSPRRGISSARPVRRKWSRSTGWHMSLGPKAVSYTHLRAHETKANLVCRLLLEEKKKKKKRAPKLDLDYNHEKAQRVDTRRAHIPR